MKGIIVKSTGSWYVVRDEAGNHYECRMKGKMRTDDSKATNPIVVGDNVEFELEVDNNEKKFGVISELLKRKNYIIRKSTNLSKQAHIIAANMDQAFLIATVANPRTSSGFIDRFLITAEAYSIPASIIFNKIDIYTADDKQILKQLKDLYEAIGYPCYEVSAITGQGLQELKDKMKGKVTLMSGHSGVGKSSLINTIEPKLNLRTGDISDAHSKGTHTTTFAEMFELSNSGFIIDTPGIKELGIIDIEKNELSHFFPEMRALFNQCKFNSCMHVNEPKCAVLAAVEQKKIAQSRYHTYISILNGDELLKEYEK